MSEDHEDQPIDPYPGIIADIDQALAMASQVARIVRGNYEAFLAEGFTDKQALYAAIAYVQGNPGPTPDG